MGGRRSSKRAAQDGPGEALSILGAARVSNGEPSAESLFFSGLENAPFGAIVAGTTPDARCAYVNREFTAITGYTLEDVPSVADWIRQAYPDPRYREWVLSRWEEDVDPGNMKRDVVYEIVRRDGERRAIQFRASLVGDGLMFVMLLDVTERLRFHEEKIQSERMQAVGQLAGGVAHDFNNILTAMRGNAEMLRLEDGIRGEARELVDQIVQAADQASDLTAQLLAFARKGRMVMGPVDVHEAIGNVRRLLGRVIDRRIDIAVDPRASRSTIRADATQIETMLLNLGLNARDAMPEGGRIVFATRNVPVGLPGAGRAGNGEPTCRDWIEIIVSDTGCGIDAELRERIFEPFFTTKEPGKGTGLGLASVYGCVKSHGGGIRVESERGRGTTFRVVLPLSAGTTRPASAAPKRVVRGAGRILVVDDEASVRNLLDRCLRRLGYTVWTCADGQEAVDFFRREHDSIDLVLLDVVMPRLDGAAALREMKRVRGDVRVLVSSGFERDRRVSEFLTAGAIGFIGKPYSLGKLSAQIARCLRTGSAGG